MEAFSDVAAARASYQVFVDALSAGREIMRRAGVPDPPPVPEFDAVFRRMKAEVRAELFSALRDQAPATPAATIQLWQPLLRKALAPR